MLNDTTGAGLDGRLIVMVKRVWRSNG